MTDIFSLLNRVVDPLFSVIDQAVTDTDERERLKAKLRAQLLDIQRETLSFQRDIIVAEAKGESWLQRNWRPIVMLMLAAIPFNNFILYPYLSQFWPETAVYLAMPPELTGLLTVGIGGYIAGRTGEKVNRERVAAQVKIAELGEGK